MIGLKMKKKKKIPTKAILDGDIIIYRAAFWADAEDPDLIPDKVAGDIQEWLPPFVEDYKVALSCSRSDNFRRDFWPNYKANRDDLYRPEFLDDVRDHILETYTCLQKPRIEADDILGIYASANKAISVTIDKDLKGVRGWHYNPTKDEDVRYISEEEAEQFFLCQWMMGDATDGIPGLWRIGPKKAEKFLAEWKEENLDPYEEIFALYEAEKYKPKDTCEMSDYDMAIAMARCVKILCKENFNLKTKKITHWSPIVG